MQPPAQAASRAAVFTTDGHALVEALGCWGPAAHMHLGWIQSAVEVLLGWGCQGRPGDSRAA